MASKAQLVSTRRLLPLLLTAAAACAPSPAAQSQAPAGPAQDADPAQGSKETARAPATSPPMADVASTPRPENTIYRSEIERALARGPGYLLYELGPEPYRLSGRFVGWEITRVFPDEPSLCRDGCDLMVGDIILSVNGDRLETPQALSNMIDALPGMDTLVIKSLRDEKRRVATYALREG